MYNPQ